MTYTQNACGEGGGGIGQVKIGMGIYSVLRLMAGLIREARQAW
jgi:hypothetical protein